ncbi:hypothetical protein K523DRAFT_401828 [Schizophyllum commune Tattone D]|nr:hypothetical protein K523DRAFT_401828 [Schizophyllum commune Tattone D]
MWWTARAKAPPNPAKAARPQVRRYQPLGVPVLHHPRLRTYAISAPFFPPAPVREIINQTMGSLLLRTPRRSVTGYLCSIPLDMIKQDFVLSTTENGNVAVWDDLFIKLDDGVQEGALSGKQILQDVVESAILGLDDYNDGVPAVAASCLLHVAEHLVKQLPEYLDCGHGPALQAGCTLTNLLNVPALPKDWISAPFLQLVYQNLLVEERADFRETSLESLVPRELLFDRFETVKIPLGPPLNTAGFFLPAVHAYGNIECHNVDKNMIDQDQVLINLDVVRKARIACASALAGLLMTWPADAFTTAFEPLLMHYIQSPAIVLMHIAATITTDWAQAYAAVAGEGAPGLAVVCPLVKGVADIALGWVQTPLPPALCAATGFHTSCELLRSSIPYLGTRIDVTGQKEGCFTLEIAAAAVGRMFQVLRDSLGRVKKKGVVVLAEKQVSISAASERYVATKGLYDVSVAAAFAATIVYVGAVSDKVTPGVNGIMDSVKPGNNAYEVTRARRTGISIDHSMTSNDGLARARMEYKAAHVDMIAKSLYTFICQDTPYNLIFAEKRTVHHGVLSAIALRPADQQKNGKVTANVEEEIVSEHNKQISARGATVTFRGLSARFGPQLLDVVPNRCTSIADGLLGQFIAASSPDEPHKFLYADANASYNLRLTQLFPVILLALQSKYTFIRQIAARSLATVCVMLTTEAMRSIIKRVVPLLAGALSLTNRQGSQSRFSVELLKSREEGRLFLIQLPNGFKVVPYENLDPVNAALPRHHEHAKRFKETHSPDAIHLPSLTICPPMLTGHCNYEILNYWCLFDFPMPGFIAMESPFNERFGKPILCYRNGKSNTGEAAALALEALHNQVMPFLSRRLNDLPPKIIQTYYCELSDVQRNMCDDFAKSRALASAEGDGVVAQSAAKKVEKQPIFQSLRYLCRLCNHPALVLMADQKAIAANIYRLGLKVDRPVDGLKDIQHAPKLLTYFGVWQKRVDRRESRIGARLLPAPYPHLYQMKQMLDIIESDLFEQYIPSVSYVRLYGGTDVRKRHALVHTFDSDSIIDCLPLTRHGGGIGLTSPRANAAIFVKHDWNPMKNLQAMDRAHRIGQKAAVNNSGLASMRTGLILDLYKRVTEEKDATAAAKKKSKDIAEAGIQGRSSKIQHPRPCERSHWTAGAIRLEDAGPCAR